MTRRIFRLRRPSLNGLCLLSLLVCGGSSWLWWHSYRADDGVVWEEWRQSTQPERVESWIIFSAGTIWFNYTRRTYSLPDAPLSEGSLDLSKVAVWRDDERISVGDSITVDVIDVSYPDAKPMNTIKVNPSGEVVLPDLYGPIRAAGRTPAELAVAVADAYREERVMKWAFVRVGTWGHALDESPPPSDRDASARYSSPPVIFGARNATHTSVVSPRRYPATYYDHWWTSGPLFDPSQSPSRWSESILQRRALETPGFSGLSIAAPCWPLCLVFAAAPVLRLAYLSFARLRRIAPNHCRRCAYDLTGNLSGECPECGTAIAVAPSTT